ncbi:MAG: ABC transporter substrate-binding protein [Dehalococcoidia bacterium]|nr:ABC transporter substrate-binding protein [Dehalococcoidia bacterium]
MKRWFYLLLAVLMLAAVIPLAGCGESKSEEPYKIGALFAVTGGNAPLGEPEKQTVEMMEEEINANGGINGHPVKIILYNYESDATKCATYADKLINEDKVVAIIGPTGTGDTLAIVDACKDAKIPLISCAAGVSIVTPTETNDKHWIFTTPQLSVMVVQKLYTYLASKNITKIAILTDTLGFGKDGKANLNGQAAAYGMTITADQTYGPNDADMLTQLTLIKNSGPQAVVCWGTSPGPAIVARNMTTLGMTDIPLFCSHGIAFQSFITAAGSSANGVIFPCGKLPVVDYLPDTDPQKALLIEYRDAFNARYGNGTANTFGGHAYDALSIVVAALKNAIEETPEKINSSSETLQTVRGKIRDYIETKVNSTGFPETGGFPGTAGIFNMSAENHNGLAMDCLVMVKIADGKWTLAD